LSAAPSGLGPEVTGGTIFRLLRPTVDYWDDNPGTVPSTGAFRKDGDIGTSMVVKTPESMKKLAEDPRWKDYGVCELDVRQLISSVPAPVMPPNTDPKRIPKREIKVHENFDEEYWGKDHVLVVGITKGLREYVRDSAIVVRSPGTMRDPLPLDDFERR
jgi:hypothetical protein